MRVSASLVCDALSIRTALEGILLAIAELAGAGLEKSFVYNCDFSKLSMSDERSRSGAATCLAQRVTGETLHNQLVVKLSMS